MSQQEQLTVERAAEALRPLRRDGERAARGSLRAQIARLERELSAIVADGFPRLSPRAGIGPADSLAGPAAASGEPFGGPRLLGLEQLELMRENRRLMTAVRRQYDLIKSLEREYPGIGKLVRDADGAISLDRDTRPSTPETH